MKFEVFSASKNQIIADFPTAHHEKSQWSDNERRINKPRPCLFFEAEKPSNFLHLALFQENFWKNFIPLISKSLWRGTILRNFRPLTDRVQSIKRSYATLCESYATASDKYCIYSDVFSFYTMQHNESYSFINLNDSHRLTMTDNIVMRSLDTVTQRQSDAKA